MSSVAQLQDLHLPEHLRNMVYTRLPVYKPHVAMCRLYYT